MARKKSNKALPKTTSSTPLALTVVGIFISHLARFKPCLPPLHPINNKRSWIGLLLLVLSAFVLYALSTPHTVMFEDDGIFVSAAYFAGTAHPPGYPLYVLLGWLISHVPFGSIAWRVHLLSGLMAALTCGCIAWLIMRRTANRPAALLAGAGLAVSEHFWSQAIIADVYTTNTALLFATLVLVQEAVAKKSTAYWIVAAVLYGLGLANHWPLLILGSFLFLEYAIAAGSHFYKRLLYLPLIALGTASILYGWMVWRSYQGTAINFSGPIESLSELWSIISRKTYAHIDSSINATYLDKLSYLQHFAVDCFHQLSILGALIATWGLFLRYSNRWGFGCASEVLAFLSSSVLLIGLLGFEYQYYFIAIFRTYPLVAYCILAMWFGYGLADLQQRCQHRWRRLSVIPSVVAALSLVAVLIFNLKSNDRVDEVFAAKRAQTLLDMIEPNGVLIISGDTYVSPLAYVHFVLGWRDDITVYETQGLLFGNRHINPQYDNHSKERYWIDFFQQTEKLLYFLPGTGPKGLGRVSHLGFLEKLDPNAPTGPRLLLTNDTARDYFKVLVTLPRSHDRWVNIGRNELLQNYGHYLALASLIEGDNKQQWQDYIAEAQVLAENNYWALSGMLRVLLRHGDNERNAHYVRKMKQLASNDRSRAQEAQLIYIEGVIAQRIGNSAHARKLYKRAIAINRRPGNPAFKALKSL